MIGQSALPQPGDELVRRVVHVIDPDALRRTRLSGELADLAMLPRLHCSLAEFRLARPEQGAVLASDDATGRSGALAIVGAAAPGTPVVLYAQELSAARIARALIDGAADYLRWPIDPKALGETLDRLEHGRAPPSPKDRRDRAWALVCALTSPQREVLFLLAQGCSTADMASRMNSSLAAIRLHRGEMMRRLQARSAAVAVGLAIEASLSEAYRRHPQLRP